MLLPCYLPRTSCALAVLAGGLLGTLVLQTGCGPGGTPVTSESSGYQAAADTSTSSPPATLGNSADSQPATTGAAPAGQPPAGENKLDKLAGQIAQAPNIEQPPTQPPLAVNPEELFNVPDGTPAELLAHLEKLDAYQPRGLTREQQIAEITKLMLARITAAEKILGQNATVEERLAAASAKASSLQMLDRTGDEQAMQKLSDFAQLLAAEKDPQVKQLGKELQFSLKVDAYLNGDIEDGKVVMDELKAILTDANLSESLFMVSREAVMAFQQQGDVDRMVEGLRLVGTTFKDSQDQEVAQEAAGILDQLSLIEVQLKVRPVLEGKPDSVPALMEAIKPILAGKEPDVNAVGMVGQIAQLLEMTGHTQPASELYGMIGTAFKDFKDPQVTEEINKMIERAQRRLGLVGKPFKVEGELIDGTPFDWAKYKGKVVLVDFWATWCGPCLEEIPNIESNYALYKDKGFEVVGVNMDDDRADVQKFFEKRQLPWPSVFSADKEKVGFENPLATMCGVEAIPFIVLVGRDGNVLALHVRGEKLGEKLAEIFGPAPESPAPGTPGADNSAAPVGDNPGQPAPPAVNPPANQQGAAAPFGARPAADDFVSTEFESAAGASASGSLVQLAQANAGTGEPAVELILPETNPYLPEKGLTPAELVDFILSMQEKPKSIQSRPGFTAGIVAAADRVLESDSGDRFQTIAALAKFQSLHRDASFGDQDADRQLAAFVEKMKDDAREKIAAEVRFLRLEREALDAAQLDPDGIRQLVAKTEKFLTDNKPTERHLRLASATVAAINRLEDGAEREKFFTSLSGLLLKGADREVIAYGKKLAPEEADDEPVAKTKSLPRK